MKLIKYIACSLLMLPTFAQAQQSDPVEDALSRLTLEEKVALTHAQSKFCSPGVARLGIPEFWMTDGPSRYSSRSFMG